MADDSLYDAVRKGGYDASIITTYNAYFPFYEEVILKRLRASECRHNVVLTDARQCAMSLSDSFAAPRRAGLEYTLVPMRSAGAFHPKILLMVGKTKGLLFVGSHNLTLAGFGYNRELTNWIEFNPKSDPAAVATARTAWVAIKDWLRSQHAYLPPAAIEAVFSVKNHAPWLDGEGSVLADPAFLAQATSTRSLLDQLVTHVPKSVKKIIVLGAFFDSNLRLLRELMTRWPNARLVCGVEPDTVSLPGKKIAREEFDFRDASRLAGRSGYLHAKAIFFEGRNGEHLLVSGSPNPSAPAWLGGNEEAVMLKKGSDAHRAANELGLLSINECSRVDNEQWATISTSVPQESMSDGARAVVVACETELGFEVPRAAFSSVPLRCMAIAGDGDHIELPLPQPDAHEMLNIQASREFRRTSRRLLFELKGQGTVEAIVHHTAEIEDLARSTKQAQFRAALQGLSTGSADIARLVTAVEKVIFDDAEAATAEISNRSRGESVSSGSDGREANLKPETLAVAVRDTKQAKRHRRLLKGTDLGYLLDVLIHRLGVGLSQVEPVVDSHGRSEEGQIGQDDDDEGEKEKRDINDIELASLCRRKVRKLVTRMKAQMDREQDAGSGPTTLVQLVAVLAVIRELRTIERHERWRRAHAPLVDSADERDLLDHVMISFFGRACDLYGRVVITLGTEAFDEVLRLKGLLMWLAWDCGVILDDRFGISEYREDIEERIWNKAALLELVQILSGDNLSFEEARTSILSVANPGVHQSAARWIDTCESLGHDVRRALARMTDSNVSSVLPSQIGALAFATALARPRLRIVSSVSDSYVTLFDFHQEIPYRPDRVSSAEALASSGLRT